MEENKKVVSPNFAWSHKGNNFMLLLDNHALRTSDQLPPGGERVKISAHQYGNTSRCKGLEYRVRG